MTRPSARPAPPSRAAPQDQPTAYAAERYRLATAKRWTEVFAPRHDPQLGRRRGDLP